MSLSSSKKTPNVESAHPPQKKAKTGPSPTTRRPPAYRSTVITNTLPPMLDSPVMVEVDHTLYCLKSGSHHTSAARYQGNGEGTVYEAFHKVFPACTSMCYSRLNRVLIGQTLILKDVSEFSCYPGSTERHVYCSMRDGSARITREKASYPTTSRRAASSDADDEYSIEGDASYLLAVIPPIKHRIHPAELGKCYSGPQLDFQGSITFKKNTILSPNSIKSFELPFTWDFYHPLQMEFADQVGRIRDVNLSATLTGSKLLIRNEGATMAELTPDMVLELPTALREICHANPIHEVHAVPYSLIVYSIVGFKVSTYPRRNDVERMVNAFFELYGGVVVTDLKWFMRFPLTDHNVSSKYYDDEKAKKMVGYEEDRCFGIMLASSVCTPQLRLDFDRFAHILSTSSKFLPVSWVETHDVARILPGLHSYPHFMVSEWPQERAALPVSGKITRIPLVCKPNGMDVIGFEAIVHHIQKSGLRRALCDVQFVAKELMPRELIHHLYPNVMERPYGADWVHYLESGPYALVILSFSNVVRDPFYSMLSLLRHACIAARIESKHVWTRNIVHCPADPVEHAANLKFIDALLLSTVEAIVPS
jgi:hypothetical protein